MDVSPVASPLDICLVANLPEGALGDTVGQGGCDYVEAYIDILGSLSTKDGRDVLAHEFLHSLQYVLNVRTRTFTFWNGSPSGYSGDASADARVQAIVDANGEKRVEDWTGK
jgi:hypothetical protein